MKSINQFLFTPLLVLISLVQGVSAQPAGGLSIRYAKDGRTDLIVPQVKPKSKPIGQSGIGKGAVVEWHENRGVPSSPDHVRFTVTLNVVPINENAVSLNVSIQRGHEVWMYASKCPAHIRGCDFAKSGLSHDRTAMKIHLKDAALDLQASPFSSSKDLLAHKSDPKDAIILNGDLYYTK